MDATPTATGAHRESHLRLGSRQAGQTRRARGDPRADGAAHSRARRALPARLLTGLTAAAALSLGLTAPASAAVIASFSAQTGMLSVFGDAQDNTITISRNTAGLILVNGGAVAIAGGAPTVANTARIQVFGLGGNDRIELDEASGALPAANLFGGPGNDALTGASGADQLFGQAGNDTLSGKGGADFLFGGSENDALTGGDRDDQVFGESGDDRMVWNTGDDSDLNEGGAGTDTIEVNGGGGTEDFSATANGSRVRFDRTSPAPFALDIGTAEQLVLSANGGDDAFTAIGNLAVLIKLTVDGGPGNDTLSGGNGADVLLGGDGADTIDGNQGNDVAHMGAGDDVFVWDPGDGSDMVDGQGNADALRVNGSGASEIIDIFANGSRVGFFRNLGNVVLDVDDVELIEFNALGGADTVTVNDLTGTAARTVAANLAGTLGGASGDGQPDTVVVNGTVGEDILVLLPGFPTPDAVTVPASVFVEVRTPEAANDTLRVNGLAADDAIDASDLTAGVLTLALNGGDGDDVLVGSAGDDILDGGAGDDALFGGPGKDVGVNGEELRDIP
jgi:Ca2+-binding RTX toxin-like protein